MFDTIAAIATALGIGSISIIRVSGSKATTIVNTLFRGKNLEEVPSHTINYGHIMDHDKVIDEVLVSVMRGPRSFTAEDVVEINCHGGIAPTNRILELLLQNGARLAEPGEFTKRAFLNGRIDLTEAEGVMDLIESKTEKMREVAIHQVEGSISSFIKDLRNTLISVIAQMEVNIDYPEYEDIKQLNHEDLTNPLIEISKKMDTVLEESRNLKIIKEGIMTSIIGRPNVGKSSLLNELLEEDKAIVTEIPGTTRDIIEGVINIDGILLHMIDTAGIRETEDIVESIGVKKSLSFIDKSELVLFVLNNNEIITEEEKELYEKIKEKNHIVIINKIDLESKLDTSFIKEKMIYISTVEKKGIQDLKRYIKELFHLEELEQNDFTYLSNARILALIKKAKMHLDESIATIQNQMPVDMALIDLKEAWNILGEVIGETYTDELLDELFSRFCLGK
ncbi:MAG: tRNA uridine-5-carboxymethylaminomethyl(34) synthesis GTPase MnmE [Bacilli bacterium]|nr:tRNA uridine-5-carboxymethylaminomethyl(34) synthesis GTPase MnmE [Bacilli bacterium]